jgi:hypothetical protein
MTLALRVLLHATIPSSACYYQLFVLGRSARVREGGAGLRKEGGGRRVGGR